MTRLLDSDRLDDVVRRGVRTVWHWVGLYLGLSPVVTALAGVIVVGDFLETGAVGVATAVGTLALALSLSLFRPTVGAARTLAFGFVTRILFAVLAMVTVGAERALSGNLLVVLDVALAAVAALSLAIAGALWLDFGVSTEAG